jgi:hypothetical protein
MKRRKSPDDQTDGQLYLRITVGRRGVSFSYSKDGSRFTEIGEPFKAREGRWIGAKVGLFAVSFAQAERNEAMRILIGFDLDHMSDKLWLRLWIGLR